jgi:hypothetical protein
LLLRQEEHQKRGDFMEVLSDENNLKGEKEKRKMVNIQFECLYMRIPI